MARKIFVCIKQVPDTETRFKLNSDPSGYDVTAIKWIVNPYDEYAIEEALKVKSLIPGSQTIAISLGPKRRTVEALRTALAMGIDDAIAIDCESDLITHNLVASALAAAIKAEGGAHVVLCGKLAIDDNAAIVPQMLSVALDSIHVTIATVATYADASATITRELEGGTKETIQIEMPAVISCNKGLNTPRYPSLPGIMKAKKKAIKELDLNSLGVSLETYRLETYLNPPDRPEGRILTGELDAQVDELVTLLRKDAKVL